MLQYKKNPLFNHSGKIKNQKLKLVKKTKWIKKHREAVSKAVTLTVD